jgi:MFS-type transporter involved in bile tolerance (Atg22 family)
MAAWASYQVAFLSELIPAPKAYLFFALFNTVGKTSSFVGPFVSSAITERAGGNTNASFWFTFGMGLVGVILLWFVDPKKAKLDNVKRKSSTFRLVCHP